MKTLTQLNKKNLFVGSTSNKPSSIVILDPTIPDRHHLISGIKNDTATYILKSQRDAIEQITTFLAQHTGIESLHIITHGSPGKIYLGATELNSSNIENYSHQFQQWRNALTANASIILYGCNVAAGKSGHQFLTQLNQLTGANIAANSQPTGNSKLGGTWDIPQLIPPSSQRAKLALTETTLKTYSGVLEFAPKVDFATGAFPTSVSIGDINGDRKPDLAVANNGSNNVSVLLNTTTTGAATSTFAPQVTFATGSFSSEVSIGDINGDGLPDLAVANTGNNNASILLNTTPKVTAVTATTADGSYGVGSTIAITVTFDATINVTGTPRLQLETGTTDQFATYISGSGGTALTFNYVVQAGDTSADLEYLATNALTLNGGTIKETVGTAFDAFLTLPALASANSLGGSKAIVIDTVAPTITSVTSTTANGSYNTTNNINLTVNFSEAVTLAGGNMTVALDTGGTVTIAPFTGTSAVGTYTPTAGQNSTDLNSTVITLATGATLRDAAVNNAILTIPTGQSLANNKAIIVDTIVPTVALTSTSPTTTNAPFSVTATFSESVTGFIASDVNLTNSTINGFTGSGTTYTFTVTPTSTGNVTVDIPAARARDVAGNNNTAATQLTRTADITAPIVALTSASPTTTNAPFLVTATFSESVTGFIASNVNLTNSTISNFTGSGTTYTFTVTPTSTGNVTVDIPAATATDTAGNNNTAATQLTRTADVTAPTANLGAISNITTAGGTSQTLTVTFSDSSGIDVSSLDNSDVVVNWSGGAIPATFVSAAPTVNGTPRTATYSFTPPGGTWDNADNGTYTVQLKGSQVKDSLGNLNAASNLGTFNVNIAPAQTPGITVSPITGLTTTEAGGKATFTVKLDSQPTASVTLGLTSNKTTEGTVDKSNVTFTPNNWNVAQTVTVTGVDDLIADGNQAYQIITAADTTTADVNYKNLKPADVALINIDNETAGITIAPTTGLTTTEAGGKATFTVQLNTQPTANVTIPLTSNKPTEGTVDKSNVTFTPNNWNIAQTVTVTGVDDLVVDGNQAYQIITAADTTTADVNYKNLKPADVALTNTDNYKAGITVSPIAGLTTTEAGGKATFTVKL